MTRRDVAEQVFNDVINTIKDSQSDLEKTVSGYATGITGKPLVDIIDSGDNIIVKADLPGFLKENIRIDMSDYALDIIAVFEEETLEEGDSYIKRERRYNEIKRTVELPVKIKADYASAEFANGVLQITLPKLEKTEVKVE